MGLDSNSAPDPFDQFQQHVQSELDQARKALNEISMMLEQSQIELNRLTQRNASINGHLQQVQAQIETIPRNDIKLAYSAALEAQQRLLVMRGQLDKLQSDQGHLQRYISILEKTQEMVGVGGKPGKGRGKSSGSAILEMLINAQEAERQRLSKQMHDGPAQAFSNFIVQTEIATRLFDLDQNRAKEELVNLKTSAMGTFQKVRGFIFELRPMMLDDLGLFPTLRKYVEAFKEQNSCDVVLSLKGQERRLPSYIEVLIFRSLQELMGNAARHNQDANSKVQIQVLVAADDTLVKVSVSDNGKGFNPDGLSETTGIGLKLIKERVEMVGGYIEIDSAISQGSRITFQVPIPEDMPDLTPKN